MNKASAEIPKTMGAKPAHGNVDVEAFGSYGKEGALRFLRCESSAACQRRGVANHSCMRYAFWRMRSLGREKRSEGKRKAGWTDATDPPPCDLRLVSRCLSAKSSPWGIHATQMHAGDIHVGDAGMRRGWPITLVQIQPAGRLGQQSMREKLRESRMSSGESLNLGLAKVRGDGIRRLVRT